MTISMVAPMVTLGDDGIDVIEGGSGEDLIAGGMG